MKPALPLFAKILFWFFLNMVIVAAALTAFFAYQPHVNLHALFGREGTNRLRSASMLIAHDLSRKPQAQWSDVLARHAEIHGVDFVIVLENGARFASDDGPFPEPVGEKVGEALRPRPPRGQPPPHHMRGGPHPIPRKRPDKGPPDVRAFGEKPPRPSGKRPHFMMRTQHPTRYWAGIPMPLLHDLLQPPEPAVLLAVSDSFTGNGFFFDPLPWMVVAAAVLIISVLFWIPMVRNITRPLARMTRATESIARGRFDVSIHEPRSDEIGRLASAINHMSARLSTFVKGQKRFLGDVSHELGSPIARIQFGLGALEQRIEEENRERVRDVLEDVAHMSNLVDELLAYSRADLKSDAVKLDRVLLLPVVQAAIKRETTPSDKVHVHIDPEIRVVASADLLTRAIANLVRNAVKYAGGAGPIDVSAEKRNGMIEIQIRDSGPGVPEDLLHQLFEPFFRPETSRTRDTGGVGLGLAIVKTCIETCKGTVAAVNLQPKGFAVTIRLGTSYKIG
jgi:two-component system sensor histidine kinase CpxA